MRGAIAVRPGYLTTEFYVIVLTIIGNVAFAASDKLPPRYAALASAVAAAAYALSRGLAKRPVIAHPVAPVPMSPSAASNVPPVTTR